MRRALTAVSFLLAGVLALEGVQPASAGGAKRRQSVEIELVGVTHQSRERHGHRFDTDKVRSLLINAHWQTIVGVHTQRLELITPDGSVYQTFTAPLESVTGTATVQTQLPVSGTWITEYSLYGRWRVNVYLDDAVTPIASARFTLAD